MWHEAGLHDADDTRAVPDAEVDTVELVGAKAGDGIVHATHGVPGRQRFPANAASPHGVGVAREVDVGRNAERIAAESQILRIAVKRRRDEVVEGIDAAGDDAERT